MATRGRIQREEEAKVFEGRVHRWHKVPVAAGKSLSAKKLVWLRWRRQAERCEQPAPDRFARFELPGEHCSPKHPMSQPGWPATAITHQPVPRQPTPQPTPSAGGAPGAAPGPAGPRPIIKLKLAVPKAEPSAGTPPPGPVAAVPIPVPEQQQQQQQQCAAGAAPTEVKQEPEAPAVTAQMHEHAVQLHAGTTAVSQLLAGWQQPPPP